MVRWDLRCTDPDPRVRADLYAAALDQAAYVEGAGFHGIVVSEHHGVDDGYLPSPLLLASAMAARTSHISIFVAALLAPLHDPLRLAEDLAVLDHLSGGRVGCVLGLGYRPEEYAQFDVSWADRGAVMDAAIETLLAAFTGEPFEHRGRTVRVTPAPLSRPHPMLFYGGGSKAAARRAGRHGLGFFPQVGAPELLEAYRQACVDAGREPGLVLSPPPGPGNVFCATDPDAFWAEHGHHLLHDATSYGEWHGTNESAVVDRSTSVEELRAGGVYLVATPDELVERCRSGEVQLVTANPLCGGLPPEAGWENLRLLGDVVLPALTP